MKKYALPLTAGLALFVFCFANTVALRLLLLTILLVAAITRYVRERPKLAEPTWFFLALGAWAALSIYWSVDPSMSLKEVKNEILYTLVAFFAFYVLARSRDVLIAGLTALALAAVTMAGLAIGGRVAADAWVFIGYYGGVGNYSTFVVAVLPLLVYMMLRVPGAVPRATLLLAATVLLVAGYGTLNRALWPALAVEVLVAAALWMGMAGRWRASLVALLSVAVFALTFVAAFDKRFGGRGAERMDVLVLEDPRVEIWSTAADAIAERPLLGVGFGRYAFGKAYPERRGASMGHAHNFFLNRTVQLGVVGLALTIALLAVLVLSLWRIFRYCPDKAIAALAGAALVYMAGLLTKNMADDFLVREVSLYFWALMGLVLGAGQGEKERETALRGVT